MNTRDLRDRHSHLIGRITTLSGGKLEGRNEHGHLKGTYDPHTDQTRDEHGHLVGKGDLLATLITAP